MGSEARTAIIDLLDEAIKDKTTRVGVIAYDLNELGIASLLLELGNQTGCGSSSATTAPGKPTSAETQAAKRPTPAAGSVTAPGLAPHRPDGRVGVWE